MPEKESPTSQSNTSAHSFAPLIEEGVPPHKMAQRAKTQLIANWNFHFPPPQYYPHPITLTPPTFTRLHKFIASRIHQMRAGKSYLRGQRSWINAHLPPECPRCGLEEETPSHTILRCPALDKYRTEDIHNIQSLNEAWDNQDLTIILGSFIAAAKINFPNTDTLSPPLTGSSLSSLSSASTSESQILGVPFNPIYAS